MKLFQKNLSTKAVVGFSMFFVGLYFWLKNYFPEWSLWNFINLEQNWPLVLILVGSYLLIDYYNK